MLPGLHCSLVGFGSLLIGAWNPSDKGTAITLSNGNLTEASSGGGSVRSTNGTSGTVKWYVEFTVSATGAAIIGAGEGAGSVTVDPGSGANASLGLQPGNGSVLVNGTNVGFSGTGAIVGGDVVGMRVDHVAKTVAFNKNGGAWSGTYIPGSGNALFIKCGGGSGGGVTINASPIYPIPSSFTYWGN